MVDKVRPLKYETSVEGTQDDSVATEMDFTEDTIVVHSTLYIHDDEVVTSGLDTNILQGMAVDVNHEMGFFDRISGFNKFKSSMLTILKDAVSVLANVGNLNFSQQFDVVNSTSDQVDISLAAGETVRVEAYPTIPQYAPDTYGIFNFDTTKHLSSHFSIANNELTIAADVGVMVIGFNITIDVTDTSRSGVTYLLQVDQGGGYIDVPSSNGASYHRTSSQGRATISFNTVEEPAIGWKYRILFQGDNTGDLITIPTGCNVYAYGISGNTGPAGEKGDAGYSGFDYLFGDGAPASGLGNDGDVYTDTGTNTGDTYKKESGSWVYKYNTIGTVTPSREFMIWAEENAGLADNSDEWSFGNGSTGAIGITMPYSGVITAMSFQADSAGTSSCNVEVHINHTSVNQSITIPTGNTTGYTTFGTPVTFNAGDVLGFYTVLGGSVSDARIAAVIKLD